MTASQIRVSCECGARLPVKSEDFKMVDGAPCCLLVVGKCFACRQKAESDARIRIHKEMSSC